jgi:hypothetical protein
MRAGGGAADTHVTFRQARRQLPSQVTPRLPTASDGADRLSNGACSHRTDATTAPGRGTPLTAGPDTKGAHHAPDHGGPGLGLGQGPGLEAVTVASSVHDCPGGRPAAGHQPLRGLPRRRERRAPDHPHRPPPARAHCQTVRHCSAGPTTPGPRPSRVSPQAEPDGRHFVTKANPMAAARYRVSPPSSSDATPPKRPTPYPKSTSARYAHPPSSRTGHWRISTSAV